MRQDKGVVKQMQYRPALTRAAAPITGIVVRPNMWLVAP